ncbi:MAG: hypothetical protein JXA43_03145, partial [Candidatus Diapherotrites archaeon]|nr:hypothetical protein [Candidatus Diapherotrites archaeon]
MNQYIKTTLSVCAIYLILLSVVASSVDAQAYTGPLDCNDRAGCDTISLSKEDVDRLWQGLYGGDSPVTFQSVEGGVLTGVKSDVDEIVTTDESGEIAHDQEISTEEFFWAGHPLDNQVCLGPFSLGAHITRDLRVAQCLSATTEEARQNCEGVYGDNDLIADLKAEVGAAPDYTKKNTLINASFNSNMLCSSGNNCNFIIFSEFEKTFNFTLSVVDIVTIAAPVVGKVATTKILGGKSVLERLKVVGDDSWTESIPILKTIVKKSYPGAYKDEVADMIEAKFKSSNVLRSKYGDEGYKSFKSVKDIDGALDDIYKKMSPRGLGETDDAARLQLQALRTEVAKKEANMAKAGGGFYNSKKGRWVSEDDYASAIAPDAKTSDITNVADNLYDDAALKKAAQANPTGGIGDFVRVPDPKVTAPDNLKILDDEVTEQIAKYRWSTDATTGGAPGLDWAQATDQQKEIYKQIAINEQKKAVLNGGTIEFVTDQGATYKVTIDKTDAEAFSKEIIKKDVLTKSTSSGGYIGLTEEAGGKIPALPKTWSEKYLPSAADQQSVAKAYAAKFGKYTGYYGYQLILRPVGRNILRTAGGAIGLPVASFAAYRIPANWSTVYMKPGSENEIYDDAYIDILYNREDDPKNPFSADGLGNGNLLQSYMVLLARLPANLPVVGDGVQSWIDDQERTDHVGDGQVYVTSLPFGKTEEEASFSAQEGVFIINNGKTSFSANALRMYALELPDSDDRELGPVVATYAHHTDLSMRMAAGEGGLSEGEINIGDAANNKEGCSDNPLTYDLLEKTGTMGEGTRLNLSAATILTAFNNNMWPILGTSFAAASGPVGIAALVPTLLGQWVINEYVVGDCIDTTGGYFVTGHLTKEEDAADAGDIATDLANAGKDFLSPTSTSDVLPTPDILKEIDANVASMLGEAAGEHPKI